MGGGTRCRAPIALPCVMAEETIIIALCGEGRFGYNFWGFFSKSWNGEGGGGGGKFSAFLIFLYPPFLFPALLLLLRGCCILFD